MTIEYNSPLENYLLRFSLKLSPYFKKYNFKPNDITTLGVMFNYTSLIALSTNEYILFIIFLLMGHFCDIMDGAYARLYHMESKFGYYYDHIADGVKIGALFYMMYMLYRNKITFFQINLILLICFISTVYFSSKARLQELNGIKHNHVNKLWSHLGKYLGDKNTLANLIKYSKYFDENFSLIYILCIISYIHFKYYRNLNVNI